MLTPAKMPRCKECGAPIRWAVTPARKRIALDDSSDPHGTYTLSRQRNYSTGEMESVAMPLTTAQREDARNRGDLLFLAHTASCIAVDRSRKKADPAHIQALIDRLDLPAQKQPRRQSTVKRTNRNA